MDKKTNRIFTTAGCRIGEKVKLTNEERIRLDSLERSLSTMSNEELFEKWLSVHDEAEYSENLYDNKNSVINKEVAMLRYELDKRLKEIGFFKK